MISASPSKSVAGDAMDAFVTRDNNRLHRVAFSFVPESTPPLNCVNAEDIDSGGSWATLKYFDW